MLTEGPYIVYAKGHLVGLAVATAPVLYRVDVECGPLTVQTTSLLIA